MEELMTLEEAAEYLKIAKPTLYRLLEEGKIPAFKVGNQWRFTRELINQWLWNQIPKGKRVLIVDDEELICELIKEVLTIDGHQTVAVQSGKEALGWVKSSAFDLVFLDLMIPDMHGVDVLASIKQLKPDLPVVVVTGYPDGDVMDRALKLGPLSVVKKPFTDEQIRTVVKIMSAASTPKEKAQARLV